MQDNGLAACNAKRRTVNNVHCCQSDKLQVRIILEALMVAIAKEPCIQYKLPSAIFSLSECF